jgi:hypothetical protein
MPKINYGRPADDRVLPGRLPVSIVQLATTRGTGRWTLDDLAQVGPDDDDVSPSVLQSSVIAMF